MSALVLGLGATGLARAGDLIMNGGFETYTMGSNSTYPAGDLQYSPVANWSSPATDSGGTTTGNFLFTPGSADTTGTYYDNTGSSPGVAVFTLWGPNNAPPGSPQYSGGGGPYLPATSPAGGNFIGLDADSSYSGALSQTVSGLTSGQTYGVYFYWAGAQLSTTYGPTTEQLQVSLGSQTLDTSVVSNASRGFTGWMAETLVFTATSSSETLSFLALGTPDGLPPFVLLDGVQMYSVPEPSTVVLLGIGLLGIARLSRRLRARAARHAAV